MDRKDHKAMHSGRFARQAHVNRRIRKRQGRIKPNPLGEGAPAKPILVKKPKD